VQDSVFDRVRNKIRESVNTRHIDHLREQEYRLLGFTQDDIDSSGVFVSNFGNGTTYPVGVSSEGEIPLFDPIVVTRDQYLLRPNPMLNNLRILVAQTRAVELTPEWRGLDTDEQELVRRDWWRQRALGQDGTGGWKLALDRTFMDFVALGVGYLRVGVNEFADGARVSAQWCDPKSVVMDPYASSYDDALFCAFTSFRDIDDAKRMYPGKEDVLEQCAQTLYSVTGVARKGVRLIEYYSVAEDKEPGWVVFAGDLGGEVIKEGANDFGFLPVGVFPNFVPPGSAFPIGLVQMQAYQSQEIIREELRMASLTEREQQLIVIASLLDPDDWQRLQDGENPRYIAFNEEAAGGLFEKMREMGISSPFMEIPRVSVSADHYNRLSYLQQQLDETSGIGANTAGTQVSGNATATEINSINSRLATQMAFFSREFARGYAAFACKVGKAAKMFDTAPFTSVVRDRGIQFNDGNPLLTSKVVWDGPLIAHIGEEELMKTDINAKQDREVIKAIQWAELTKSPESLRRVADAMGYRNIEGEIPSPAPEMPATAGMPTGLPGTPPVAG
jgi:hypothetical protein